MYTNTADRIFSNYAVSSDAVVIRKDTAESEFAPLSEVQNSKSYKGQFG